MTSISNIWKQLTSILSNLNNFHSLEVVDRVSETQLQVDENLDWIIWRLKGWGPVSLQSSGQSLSNFNEKGAERKRTLEDVGDRRRGARWPLMVVGVIGERIGSGREFLWHVKNCSVFQRSALSVLWAMDGRFRWVGGRDEKQTVARWTMKTQRAPS